MLKPDLSLLNFCLAQDLRSFDPYDIWKTGVGLKVKALFNKHRLLGAGPAMVLSLYDLLLNNGLRVGYKKQEFPIARALAAQALLAVYNTTRDPDLLRAAREHLQWLVLNSCTGYSGACWGIGFDWPAGAGIFYDKNTPHATHTPYALEAMHLYTASTGDDAYEATIRSCFQFFEKDLLVMYEDDQSLAISYGPFKDRLVTNAVSYAMYSYAIFLSYFPGQKDYIARKIEKMYRFVADKQQHDGSWLYSPGEGTSFIDCFHSCFILKNLIKTQKIIALPGVDDLIARGYQYLCENFFDGEYGLYKRFTKRANLSLVRFDLYDNSEMLHVAHLLNDTARVASLKAAIEKHFVSGPHIYSVIDFMKRKRNRNMLRWAVMPYVFAMSSLK